MKTQSDAILFFVEAFYRWGHKSPKYLRVWKAANWIISALAFTPLILSKMHIITTDATTTIILAAVGFSGAYGGAMNKLTVSNMEATPTPFTDKKNSEIG